MSNKRTSLFGLSMKPKSDAGAAPAGSPVPTSKKDTNKRWIAVAAGAAVFLVAASAMFADKPVQQRQAQQTDPNQAVVDVTPRGVEAKSVQKALQVDMTELRADNSRLQAELNDLKRGLENNRQLPSGVVAPPVSPDARNTGALGVVDQIPPPPVPIPVLPDFKKDLPPVPTGLPPIMPMGDLTAPAGPMVFKPEKKVKAAPANGAVSPSALANAVADTANPEGLDTIKGKVEYKKNPYNGFIPAGAFAPITLLNGLDAGTSASTQSNPMPVLMNIQDHANLPGAAKYKIRNCFVLASAYGDLSSERVYGRLSTLSCVDKNEKLVLSTPVQGYLVDSDGKIGMRGVIIDRQGAKLAKALLAGFAQGLAGALGSAQSTVSSSSLGTVSTINGSNALQASGLQGGATAAQQLAQFYLKEASSIFPVISVDTGRTGTIVFTQGVSLSWGEAEPKFVKEVRPE